LNENGVLAMDQRELDYLSNFLAAGDRGGFYLGYYNMTGSEQAFEQAQISTLSEVKGALALSANGFLQGVFGPGYAGVYFISQKVAESGLEIMRQGAVDGNQTTVAKTGYLSDAEFYTTAFRAWQRPPVAHPNLFPGNFLLNPDTILTPDFFVLGLQRLGSRSYLESIAPLPHPQFSAAAFGSTRTLFREKMAQVLVARIFGATVPPLGSAGHAYFFQAYLADPDFRAQLAGNPAFAGQIATQLTLLDAALAGKRVSDFAGHGDYGIFATPDGRVSIATRNSSGKTEAAFDLAPFSHTDRAAALPLKAISSSVTRRLAPSRLDAADLPAAAEFRRGLVETNTTSFNGDVNPTQQNPAFNPSPRWRLSASPTGSDETLWSTPTGSTMDAGGGDDFVFGGGKRDVLSGGAGNDVLYGREGADELRGDEGDDMLRGGAGGDFLFGDGGDDILDGGDFNPNVLSGDDRLEGGAGNDLLIGGTGTDHLFGGAGDDELIGGKGNDEMSGEAGNDTYKLQAGDGRDLLRDSDGNGAIFLGNEQLTAAERVFNKTGKYQWKSADGRYVYSQTFGDVRTGATIAVTSTAFSAGQGLSLLNVKLTQGNPYLGLNLSIERKVALQPGTGSNPFALSSFSPTNLAANLAEAGAKMFSIFLDTAAKAGEKLLLAIPGGGAVLQFLKVKLGSQEASLAGGTAEVMLAEGQTQVTFELVEEGDVDADAALSFSATLQSDEPNFTPVTSNTVTINFDARDEADPVTTNDIFGDRGHEQVTVNGQTVTLIDQWGNPVTTAEVIPGRFDFRFDTPGNDNIQTGGADFLGPDEDYVRAFRGGDDVIEQTGAGRIWAHGGAGNDVMVGGEGPGTNRLSLSLRQDMLNGGAGDDRIYGETRISLGDAIEAGRTEAASSNTFEGDFLAGNAGDDLLIAGTDRDLLAGGGGKDIMVARAGDDVVLGDADYSAADVRDLGYAGWGWAGMYWIETGTPEDFVLSVHNVHPGAVDDPADSDADTIYAGNGDDLVLAGGGDDVAYGEAGDDRLWGEGGADFLQGGAGNDVLVGEATSAPVAQQGSDFLDGGDGNDKLLGGGASDALYGGAGNDEISGDSADQNAGDDYISGEAGDDLLVGAGGADEIHGGTGDDIIGGDASNAGSAVHGADFIDAGAGDDQVAGGGGGDTIFGGAGDDVLEGDGDGSAASVQGGDYLDGGAGDDRIAGNGGADTIFGGAGDDQLFGEGADDPAGTAGNDFIDGGAGDDVLVGAAGSDVLVGGEGKDQLFGESADPNEAQGNDVLEGGAGDDLLNGGGGADTLIGGDGVDRLEGDAADTAAAAMGDDSLDGGEGNDSLAGAGGNDKLEGGAGDDKLDGDGGNIAAALHGNDQLSGGAGADDLIGGGGHDTLDGGEGDDTLQGGDGDDTLEGGDGDDILTGGTGSNVLSGGAGNDFYFFRRGDGFQRIIDPDGVDVLFVEPGLTIFDLRFSIGSLKITDGVAGDEIHIEGFDPNDPLGTLAIEQIAFLGDGSVYDLAELIEDLGFDITGTPEPDLLEGTALDDRIDGLGADDLITGGTGSDVIDGGDGADIVDGGEGFDLVLGGEGDDFVLGEDGADFLDGGEGADALMGGAGDDSYVVDPTDTVSENPDEGYDFVEADFSCTLEANFEELNLAGDEEGLVGTGNDEANAISANEAGSTLLGMGGDDVLLGHFGNDTLDGGAGIDVMEGSDGDDLYVVDDSSDLVVEQDFWFSSEVITQGHDTVESSVSFDLPKFVEELFLTGDAEIDGGGNSEQNFLSGNDAANVLVSTVLDGKNDNLVSEFGLIFLDFPGAFPTGADERVWDRALRRYFENEITSDQLQSIGERISVDARWGDVLEGNGGNDRLIGGWDHDQLYGGEGDDLLLGSGGADYMEGGAGDDIYVVDGDFSFGFGYGNSASISYQDDSSDELFEYEYQGTDAVWANVDWALDKNFENLLLIDFSVAIEGVTPGDGLIALHLSPIVGEGNELANEITGNSRANELYGYEGDDTLRGGRGADRLDGGDGADVMRGGVHDDTYWVDDAGDQVIETGNGFTFNGFDADPDGFADWVISSIDYTLGEFVENLELNGEDAFAGTGNALGNIILGSDNDNVLAGLGGDDSIDGRAGDDFMTGGEGDDTYFVDSLGDTTAESFDEGHDTVYSTQSTTLGDNLEDLYLLGTDDLEGIGNAVDNLIVGNDGSNLLQGLGGDDTVEGGWGGDRIEGGEGADALSGGGDGDELYGGEGSDSLDGGEGADYLEGGAGDESYFVDDDFDEVLENFGEGTDSVFERVFSYQTPDNVENATILGDFQDDPDFAELFGNTLDNSLTGSDGHNHIDDFAGGHDTVDGRAGSDSLHGQAGNDILYGGDDATRIESDHFRFDKDDGVWRETDSEDDDAVELELEVLADNHDFIAGGEGVDDIDDGSGNDSLQGDAGNDVLYGGDDGLTADRFSGDGGEGGFELGVPVFLSNNDFLAGDDGDDFLDGGSGDDDLFGGDGADNLYGGDDGPLNTSNRDFLDGGTSSSIDTLDTMAGGTDNDEYVVDGFFVETIGTIISDCGDPIPNQLIRVWTTDLVIENAGEGDDDGVFSRADYTLPDNVEDLVLAEGALVLFGRGNSLDNGIEGNSNHNRLEGAGGNDFIFGGHGNDVIDGGEGDDTLLGWFGNDKYLMRAGSGRDTVQFDGIAGPNNADTVHLVEHLEAADITLSRHHNDVVIGLNGTSDRMVLQHWFLSSTAGVSQIIFCDDPALNRAMIAELANRRFVVASEDVAAVAEDGEQVATGNVLDNDNEAGSHPASALHVSNWGTFTGAYGTLVLAENGDYTYTLNNDAVQWFSEGQVTVDTFLYEAEDEAQAFSEATLVVDIAGANDAPVIVSADALGSVTEDAGVIEYDLDFESPVENGSFEDDFFGWELAGNTSLVDTDFIFFSPDGSIRYASFGAIGSPTLLSQEIDTEADQRYLLRFYLDSNFDEDDEGAAEFSASWNGETLMALGKVDLDEFTLFEFVVTGADSSQLEFSLQNDPDYWGLDAITLQAIFDEDVSTNEVQSAHGTTEFTDIDQLDEHFLHVTPQGGDYVGEFSAFIDDDSTFGELGIAEWSFNVENAALDYLAEGDTLTQSYDVTVNDFFGGSDTRTVTVLVHGANDAPEAFAFAASVEEDVSLVVTGNVIDEYVLDPDEGAELTVTNADTYVGEWGTLVLDADGTYTYTLDNDAVQFLRWDQQLEDLFVYGVSDGALSSAAEVFINILGTNDAPTTVADFADVMEDAVSTAGGNVLDNDFDIDEDETPAVSTTGTFAGLYGTLTLAEDGAYEYLLDNDLEAVQRLHAGEELRDEFAHEAFDGLAGNPGLLTVRVAGANDAPVANADTAQGHEDGVLTASGNALANDFDRDHGTLLEVADPGSRAGLYGKLRLKADGSFTYTLKNKLADFLPEGEIVHDTFSYTATDADPLDPLTAESSITVTVVGANDAPVTVKDLADVSEDGVLAASGNVLGNDSDPDSGTALSVAHAGTYAGNFGTLSLQSDGSYTYELANDSTRVQSLRAGQTVSDVFAYVAGDGMAQAPGRLTVRIAGANDPSQAFADSATVQEDLTPVATGNVLINDQDPDLGVLLTVTNPGTYVGAHGTLTLTAQGRYTYTLDNAAAQPLDDEDVLTEVFTYTAGDGATESSSTLTVTILGLNDRPGAVADFADVAEDAVLLASSNVLDNDIDVDDGLTAIVPGTYAGAYGTLTLESDGDYFYELNNAALSVQSLRHGQTVSDVFAYSAVDDQVGTLSTLTVRVAGANDSPVTQNDSALASEDGVFSVSGDVLANDHDIDQGTVLTIGNAGSQVGAYGTLLVNEAGRYTYALNNASTAVQSLAAGQEVFDRFDYQATDGIASSTAQLAVTVTGANDAPLLVNAIPDRNADAGIEFRFTLAANAFADIDQGDRLSYTARLTDGSALPDWLAFDGATRTFIGTPPGGGGCDCNCEGEGVDRLDIRVTATDLHAATAFDEFTLNIEGGAAGGGMTIIGTDGNDVLVGTPCDDIIDGRKGFDRMSGGDGDDTYYVDKTCPPQHGHKDDHEDDDEDCKGDDHHDDQHGGKECKIDEVIEQANHGWDIVYAAADYTLAANVEELRLLGHADLDGAGNALGNTLVGNAGDNRLKGGLGADVYVHERDGGDDVIEEIGPDADTLLLGEGISASMVRLQRRHDDLLVDPSGPHGSVTIKDWFASSSKRVESIQFADGTTWGVQQIHDRTQRHDDDECAGPRHDHDHDDDHRDRHDGHDRDSKDKHDDDKDKDKRDQGYDWGGGRSSRRLDFEELHELLGREGRAMEKDEIAARWRAVAEHARSLGAQDGDGESAWLPGSHQEVAGHGGMRWGFEGSIGAPRGQDGLRTLEGLLEGFRKL